MEPCKRREGPGEDARYSCVLFSSPLALGEVRSLLSRPLTIVGGFLSFRKAKEICFIHDVV